jgi:rhombotail lipoprotein
MRGAGGAALSRQAAVPFRKQVFETRGGGTMKAVKACCLMGLMAAIAAAAGCAVTRYEPSFERSAYGGMIGAATVRMGGVIRETRELTEQELQKEVDRLLQLKPAAVVPLKVVVYGVPGSGRNKVQNPLKLLELRKVAAQSMKESLKATGLFKEVDFLPEILLPATPPPDLHTLRVAAARAQADGLLIYSTEAGFQRKINLWALLYPTIIGAAIFPGTEDSSIALSNAVLLDVPTGYVYFVAEEYGEKAQCVPGGEADPEKLEYEARTESVAKLSQSVADKAKALKEKR